MSEHSGVVIDCGSFMTKCGYIGDDCPTSAFLTMVGTWKNPSVMKNFDKNIDPNDFFVGDEAQAKRGVLKNKHPVEYGIVNNWNEMEKIYHHIFDNELKIKENTEDCAVMLTEPPSNPKNNREKMTSIMFETFKVPLLYVGIQAVLALYSSGRCTALVIDCGDTGTHFVPIYSGYAFHHFVRTQNLGGRDIRNRLVKIIEDRGYFMETSAEMEIARDIKEKLCYVAPDYEEELKKAENSAFCEQHYELPDGSRMTIGAERFKATEIIFKPSLIGSENNGLHTDAFESMQRVDVCERSILYRNIELVGGSSLLPGLKERVQREIVKLGPRNCTIKVHAPDVRKFSTWIGASILASLSTFDRSWITKKEYEEKGSSIVHRKCF